MRPSPSIFRIRPSIWIGILAILAYTAVGQINSLFNDIPYADSFDSVSNAVRVAVVPVGISAVLLLIFVLWTRWDYIWKDPSRTRMTRFQTILLALFVVTTLVRFLSVDFGKVDLSLLLVILLSAALVGFAEDLLFRGVFLRVMRTSGRPEGMAALWTVIAFGLFHLPNVFAGTGLVGLLQIFLTAGAGYVFYLWRRSTALLVAAMMAHAFWDASTFLAGSAGAGVWSSVTTVLSPLTSILALGAAIYYARKDRSVVIEDQAAAQPA